jgi:hypothetical protein
MLNVPAKIRMANVPENSEQPGLDGRTAPVVETTLRAEKAFLDGILCVRLIAHEEISEPIGVIETWKRDLSKALGTVGHGSKSVITYLPLALPEIGRMLSVFQAPGRGLSRQAYGLRRRHPHDANALLIT